MVFRCELENLLTKMKRQRDIVNKRVSDIRPGRLMITLRGNGLEYFNEHYIEGKRIRKSIGKDAAIIRELAQKQHMTVQLQLLNKDIELLEKLLADFIEPDNANIMERLPERIKKLPDDMFFGEDRDGRRYNQSTYRPEGRTHTTSHGLKVRSKSELLIAEKFYEYNLDFHYEEVLEIGRHTVVPDFTITRWDGKVFYWEQLKVRYVRNYLIN